MKKFLKNLGTMKTITFELDEKQTERYRKWANAHIEQQNHSTTHFREACNVSFTFMFVPGWCGTNVKVKCNSCVDASVDLTIDEDGDGEFLLNEDGSRNGW